MFASTSIAFEKVNWKRSVLMGLEYMPGPGARDFLDGVMHEQPDILAHHVDEIVRMMDTMQGITIRGTMYPRSSSRLILSILSYSISVSDHVMSFCWMALSGGPYPALGIVGREPRSMRSARHGSRRHYTSASSSSSCDTWSYVDTR